VNSKYKHFWEEALNLKLDIVLYLGRPQSVTKDYQDNLREDWQKYLSEKLNEMSVTAKPTNSSPQPVPPQNPQSP
jgi:hypothetical protein